MRCVIKLSKSDQQACCYGPSGKTRSSLGTYTPLNMYLHAFLVNVRQNKNQNFRARMNFKH